jgi:hypothetical protein
MVSLPVAVFTLIPVIMEIVSDPLEIHTASSSATTYPGIVEAYGRANQAAGRRLTINTTGLLLLLLVRPLHPEVYQLLVGFPKAKRTLVVFQFWTFASQYAYLQPLPHTSWDGS